MQPWRAHRRHLNLTCFNPYPGGEEALLTHHIFQSLSRSQAGCYIRRGRSVSSHTGFNPHPALRPDVTRPLPLVHSVPKVSILIRLSGRMLPKRATRIPTLRVFQSSSGSQAGCYTSRSVSSRLMMSFNPHPALRPDVTDGTGS